jgi:restriction system protein
VWSLTERGRSTSPTLDEAGEVSPFWARIFLQQRRARADNPDPTDAVVAEGVTGATLTSYGAAALDRLLLIAPSDF